MPRFLLTAALLALFELATRRELLAQDRKVDTAFIRIALEHIYKVGRPRRVIIRDRILALPQVDPPVLPSCDSLGLRRFISPVKPPCGKTVLDSIPSELTVGAIPQLWGPPEWIQAEMPPGVSIVPDSTIQASFGKANLGTSWRDYYANYPDTRGFESFSHALLTVDGLQALGYVYHACGSLCGEWAYVWLRRDTVEGPWRLYRWITLAVS